VSLKQMPLSSGPAHDGSRRRGLSLTISCKAVQRMLPNLKES
jgi:hypothetical protein